MKRERKKERELLIRVTAQTYENCSVSSIFRHLVAYVRTAKNVVLHVVSHVVACPIVFILLFDQGRQGGVLKLMKNDHF